MGPAQQAGIRCEEPAFAAFLRECYADAYNETAGPANEFERAAQCVRLICGVDSRAHIKPGTGAAASWMMIDADFRAWKLAPEVGA